ncbi:MAG: dihydroneopterin aldolase [Brevefilum sp.]|jgi:dihydroneopterin aldolase
MDTIFIDNLEVNGILGIHAHEQRTPQLIRISVRLTTDTSEAAAHDDIHKTINYSELAKGIIQFVGQNHYYTIEAMIDALAEKILTDNRIQNLWLRIEKPNAVPMAESVGVEISRTKKA